MGATVQGHPIGPDDPMQNPGDFRIDEGSHWLEGLTKFSFICPCPCGRLAVIAIKQGGNERGHHWGWDGSKTEPTLTPSIHRLDCGWHGYLKRGVWESV